MRDIYILDDQKDPVPAKDLLTWALWMDAASTDGRSRVGDAYIGDFRISTIFIGKDMNFTDQLDPILFETMIFHLGEIVFQTRYKSWESARETHDMIVERLHETEEVSAKAANDKIAELRLKTMSPNNGKNSPGSNAD